MPPLILTPDLTSMTRAEVEALAERLLFDAASQHGGLRQACVYYGIPAQVA